MFTIMFDGNLFWLLLIPVAATGAFLVYRSSDTGVKRLLQILRGTTLGLILLLLTQPVLTVEQGKEERPTLTVLVDGSASMQLVDTVDGRVNGRSRGEVVKEILGSHTMMDIRRHADIRGIVFSDGVHPFSPDRVDSLSFRGGRTDLATALRQGGEEQAVGMILLSDGVDNVGGDVESAATDAGIPVFVVGIGGTERQSDVQVTDIRSEDTGFVGETLTMRTRITDQGEGGTHITVYLKGENGEIFDRRDVTLAGDGKEQEIVFHTSLREPAGLHRYTVEIPPVEGEASTLNNSASTVVPVFKEKRAVLIVCGQPCWEFAFLKRTLETMEDVGVTSLIARKGGGFLDGTFPDDLGSFDLLILLDVPSDVIQGRIDEQVTTFVRQGGALLFVGGSHTLGRGYQSLRLVDLLMVNPVNREHTFRFDRFVPELTSVGQDHPIMHISGNHHNIEAWRELPPFAGYNEVKEIQPRSLILGTHPTVRLGEEKMPMFVFSSAEKGRVFLTLCSPFWMVEFLPWGSGGSGNPVQTFWRQVVRWLTTPEMLHPVTITTDRPIYRGGMPVAVEARVFDEMFHPNDEAEVLVRVRGEEGIRETYLTHVGRGYYRGRIPGLRAGDYRFEGTASTAQRVIGSASGSFTVDRQSVEFQETRMNEYLLKGIATRSGGKFYRQGEVDNLFRDFQPATYESVVTHHLDLRKNGWIWLTILLLVGGEWMIRRRKGMA
ncbi:MAG: hypothetical protein HY709_02845 [Candidatus Latescibacteria bacterium]|nr:hypothetical protein [Candidatus Latescibacterota bacterium]